MEKESIISGISKRGNGEIYLGVVGAVRTGKSTFIKRFIENLVVPNIEDEYEKKKCLDEIPQSAEGKTIMTTEPKFVPSSGAKIKVNNFETNIKLVDCVGYVIPDANGFVDEDGNPRMVKSPWNEDAIPFVEAAEIGTEKVIKDHATIGIVVTTDGSFGEIPRNSYLEAEEKVINELKSIGKPFIVILNSSKPDNEETRTLAREIETKHDVPVMPISVENMSESEIMEILKQALYEFPVLDIEVSIPEWVHILPNTHKIKAHYLDKIRESIVNVQKLKDVDDITKHFEDSEYISKAYVSNLDTATGIVTINLESEESLYNDTLKEIMGETILSKASLLKIFTSYKDNEEELSSIKNALKMAKTTGYGIMYPSIKDMKLDPPEIIKQGS
jgi:stage IV sporulation protein A